MCLVSNDVQVTLAATGNSEGLRRLRVKCRYVDILISGNQTESFRFRAVNVSCVHSSSGVVGRSTVAAVTDPPPDRIILEGDRPASEKTTASRSPLLDPHLFLGVREVAANEKQLLCRKWTKNIGIKIKRTVSHMRVVEAKRELQPTGKRLVEAKCLEVRFSFQVKRGTHGQDTAPADLHFHQRMQGAKKLFENAMQLVSALIHSAIPHCPREPPSSGLDVFRHDHFCKFTEHIRLFWIAVRAMANHANQQETKKPFPVCWTNALQVFPAENRPQAFVTEKHRMQDASRSVDVFADLQGSKQHGGIGRAWQMAKTLQHCLARNAEPFIKGCGRTVESIPEVSEREHRDILARMVRVPLRDPENAAGAESQKNCTGPGRLPGNTDNPSGQKASEVYDWHPMRSPATFSSNTERMTWP
jgi:hypothetical protein